MKKATLCFFSVLVLAGTLHRLDGQIATITIDTTVRHQTMNGWEATAFIGAANATALPRYRDELLRIAAEDIGVTRIRLEVRSGSENPVDHYALWASRGYPQSDSLYQEWRGNRYATVNDNADSSINWSGFHFTDLDWRVEHVVLPLRDAVAATGGRLHINICYVAFTGQIRNGVYIHDDPDEYAEFVLATWLHLQRVYGLVPDTWEVLLEPDNVQQWNGTLLGRAISATAQRLQSWGFTPAFVAPSTTSMANAVTYFDAMIAVPDALRNLVEFSYHRYLGVSRANLDAIAARARQYGLRTSMLEWWFGRATHEVLFEDLRYGLNSAWQDRTLLGMIKVDTSDIQRPVMDIDEVTDYNRVYFRHVRPGMTRVETTGETADHRALAFIDQKGAMVVILDCKQTGTVRLMGLAPGEYGVVYSTPGDLFARSGNITVPGTGQCDVVAPVGVMALSYIPGTSAVHDLPVAEIRVQLAPNPLRTASTLRIDAPGESAGGFRFLVFDMLGRVVLEETDLSVPKIIRRQSLHSGVFRYLVLDGTAIRASGALTILD